MKIKVKDSLTQRYWYQEIVPPTKEELADLKKGDLVLALMEVRQLSVGFWSHSNDKANTHWYTKDRIIAVVEKAGDAALPEKVFGYTMQELQDGLNFAKARGWSVEEKKKSVRDKIWDIFGKYSMNYSRPALEEILEEFRNIVEEVRVMDIEKPCFMPLPLRSKYDVAVSKIKIINTLLAKLK